MTCSLSSGQVTPVMIREAISGAAPAGRDNLSTFYAARGYKMAWLRQENRPALDTLIAAIARCRTNGLEPEDYSPALLDALKEHRASLTSAGDSVKTEMAVTAAAIHYYSDLSFGNIKPAFGYQGFVNAPDIGTLITSIASDELRPAPKPDHVAQVAQLEALLAIIMERKANQPIETTVKFSRGATNTVELASRLYELGITGSMTATPDSLVKKDIKNAQRMFNLTPDGMLTRETVLELNTPVSQRISQLKLAINYYRWLSAATKNRDVVVVNVPAAFMTVYHDCKPVLRMRMVVGKPSTPTPVFTSIIGKAVLYPYWYVPHNIAAGELLPVFKRDPGYVTAGNYQVIGSNGRLINPRSVRWSSYSVSNFPFTIRQGTGCDNALGLLKLDFESPYGVYLHDTPVKIAFGLNRRFLSHGCMRMENPLALGHMVLRDHPEAIDTLTEKGCLLSQAPINVPADVKMPVIVWYNPVDTDGSGRVVFYQDIYHKFNWH